MAAWNNYRHFKIFTTPRDEVIKHNNLFEVDNSNTKKKTVISGD
jgi:hypothetical protein